ncbi:hypothetical protein VNO78_10117 [Psophocarpus tetragonolobus]|uniref:OVATE domain-containing protein n=1 Tax=Psophocarpus tetragonolobus TaxID=3891 RepID=A0AAN9SK96_PSOTE
MPLGSSISINTKKLLQRSLENLKCCLSAGYKRLPKTKQSMELEKVYSDLTKQWDSEKERRGCKCECNARDRVEKKLRELLKLNMSDVDHVLDIEEVLHYYSRLTCPLYLEIVDKLFMQLYSEFFPALVPCASIG